MAFTPSWHSPTRHSPTWLFTPHHDEVQNGLGGSAPLSHILEHYQKCATTQLQQRCNHCQLQFLFASVLLCCFFLTNRLQCPRAVSVHVRVQFGKAGVGGTSKEHPPWRIAIQTPTECTVASKCRCISTKFFSGFWISECGSIDVEYLFKH